MQAALFLLRLLPPPAPGAFRLARRHRAGAWRAADRQKTAVMRQVVRNLLRVYEVSGLLPRPVEQRVYFDQVVLLIERNEREVGAVDGLVATNAGDPCRAAVENARQWCDLADRATVQPGGD